VKHVSLILTSAVCLTLASGCNKKAEDENTQVSPPTVAPSFAPVTQPESKNMEATLVTVDGKSLTRAMAMRMAQEMAARQGVPPQMLEQFMSQMGGQLEKQAIDQFINQSLIEKEATRQEIPVSDEEIDAVIAQLSGTLPEGMTLEQALQAQNMQLADLRTSITGNERMRKLYEAQTAEAAKATDEEIAAFFTENAERFKTEESASANHILISCDEKADEAAHAKAKADTEAILAKVNEGGDFAALAKEHSSCPSKDKGGSLGSFGRGRMVPEFEEAAFSQEIGTVGGVVKTQFGYHLIQVTERTEGGARTLEEVSDEIRTHLDRQAQEAIFGTFIEGLREKAEITYPKSDA